MIVIGGPLRAYAEEVNVSSFSLEDSTIIVLDNKSNKDIHSFRIWLAIENNFESLKTEKSWVGKINTNGVIVFKSPQPLEPGESIKFGVKTNTNTPAINWKALDKNNETIATGKVLSGSIPLVEKIETSTNNQNLSNTAIVTTSITSDSKFRTVPQNPTIGNSFRLTGEQFGASYDFDFYLDSAKIGSFVTDKNGNFITTFKIPDELKSGRMDFKIKDNENKEKTISLRVEKVEKREITTKIVKLTISNIPKVLHRGDFVEISGTGDPNSTIISTITDEQGNIYATRTAEINSKGNWKLVDPLIISLNMPFGQYSTTITDGRENILKNWLIESDKTIIITPISLKFERGEKMIFDAVVVPDTPLEIIIENPLGKEVFSDIYQIDKTGIMNFEYKVKRTDIHGTYTITAIQNNVREFTFTGVGELPIIPVNLKFDKLAYKSGDTAHIIFTGKSSDVISFLLLDPSEQPKGQAISITLQPDGRGTYDLDLKGFNSGVYTAVVSKGSAQSTEIFALGLQTGSGEIKINTTKKEYLPNDSILILGKTDANIILSITMKDSKGKIIKEKEVFSDKEGNFSDNSFRIPSDGIIGTWIIHAKSGLNYDVLEIGVIPELSEGLMVTVQEGKEYGKSNEPMMIFRVIGAQQSADIEIVSQNGKIIDTLSVIATSQGEIKLPWTIPPETAPGTYTIKVVDGFDSIQTDFEIK